MNQHDRSAFAADSSFLTGANAAYIEDLYARYEVNPQLVDPEWQRYFESLNDAPADVSKSAQGASWKKPNWPVHANGEMVSALDGNWGISEKILTAKIIARAETLSATGISPADLQQATRDSVRAIMMIRAYRMRGHLHAQLDPLGLERKRDHEELHPSSYGFTEADYDRKIFIDKVLGLEYATIFEMLAILRRTYCSTLGYEFMHISNPQEKSLDSGTH